MMNHNITWQALERGVICNSQFGLPKKCDTLNLLVDGKIKISIDCKGEPFYFVRHFFYCGLNQKPIETNTEYHIGYNGKDKLEYIYTPKTDEVISCFGDAKI